MSDEPTKDVSPLRLKRPAVSSSPAPASPPTGAPPAGAPNLMAGDALIGGLPDKAGLPEVSPAGDAPMAPRRRPSLSLPAVESPVSDPAVSPSASDASVIRGDAAAQQESLPVKEQAAPAIKLRIGAKPASPAPATPAELPDPFADMDDKQPPLVPLQTLAPFPFKKPGAATPAKPVAPPPPIKFSTPPIPGSVALPSFPPPAPASAPTGVPSGGAAAPFPVARAATLPPIPAPAAATISLPEVRAAVRKKRPVWMPVVMILLFVLLCATGAYLYFSEGEPAPVVIERPAAPPLPVAEPAPVVEPPPVVVEVAPDVGVPESVPVIAVAEPVPVVIEPTAPPPPPPPPVASAGFIRFSEAMTVSGVFQGTPARALVNGRLARVGDEIEPSLRIKFVGVDAATKHLILEEGSGAQLRVKY